MFNKTGDKTGNNGAIAPRARYMHMPHTQHGATAHAHAYTTLGET